MRQSLQEDCHLGSAVLDLHFTKIIDIWLLGVFYYHFLNYPKVPKVKTLVTGVLNGKNFKIDLLLLESIN